MVAVDRSKPVGRVTTTYDGLAPFGPLRQHTDYDVRASGARPNLERAPEHLEQTGGQTDRRVAFMAHTTGHARLTANETFLMLHRGPYTRDHSRAQRGPVRLGFTGANTSRDIEAETRAAFNSVVVDPSRNAYVTGLAGSQDFRTTSALQAA